MLRLSEYKSCCFCVRLKEDRLSSSSFLYRICKVPFFPCKSQPIMMLTVQSRDDGRNTGAQAVHLNDLQAQTCRFGKRESATLRVAPG